MMATGRHVALLVEDDPATASELKEVLSILDCDCLHAATQEAALALIEKGGFCFALCDLQIKKNEGSITARLEAGQAVAEEIRRRYRVKNDATGIHWLPIVIMSGHAKEIAHAVRMMRKGADDYLTKPFEETVEVADTVRDVLEHSGRHNHDLCLEINRRARGEHGPDVASPAGAGIRLVLTGGRDVQRNEIFLGEKRVTLPNSAFIVLLYLVAARRSGEHWVHKSHFGDKDVWKETSRLRRELTSQMPKGVTIDQNDKQGSYRLHQNIELARVDHEALRDHEEARVRELAVLIADGRALGNVNRKTSKRHEMHA